MNKKEVNQQSPISGNTKELLTVSDVIAELQKLDGSLPLSIREDEHGFILPIKDIFVASGDGDFAIITLDYSSLELLKNSDKELLDNMTEVFKQECSD